MANHWGQSESGVQTLDKTVLKRPSMYKVILRNDDYTPMEFVVSILQEIFRKPEPEAVQIMLSVHKRGFGVAGVYPFEIAETKVAKVHQAARANGHPLKCTLEEA